MRQRCVTGLLVSLALTILAAHQDSETPQAPPIFRLAVDLVPIDVTVLDRQRKPVRGLHATDFTVLDNGVPQPIVSFASIDLASEQSEGSAHGLGLARPLGTPNLLSDYGAGRLVMIVVETYLMRGPAAARAQTARAIALAIVAGLGPKDVGLVAFPGAGIAQVMTSDQRRLRAAIVAPFRDSAGAEPAKRVSSCSAPLELLVDLAESIRNSPRRKILFYVGNSLTIQAPGATCLEGVRNKLFALLKEANITVHSFDTAGLQTLARGADTGMRPGTNRTGLMMSHLVRQGNLLVLPDLTGGRGIMNTNSPEEHVPSVLAETTQYYVLGIVANGKADKEPHRLDVRSRVPDAIIQARQTYSVSSFQ